MLTNDYEKHFGNLTFPIFEFITLLFIKIHSILVFKNNHKLIDFQNNNQNLG